jgi:hypothetical protein
MATKVSGHLSTVSFGSSGFTAAFTELGGASYSRPSLGTTDLLTDGGDTFIPGDTYDPGESQYTFYFNTSYLPPIDGAAETIILTYGGQGGDTISRSGFITGYEEGAAKTNEVMMANVTVKWSGNPSYSGDHS